jgi:hypothetical protein
MRLSAVLVACTLSGAGTLADTTPLRILDPTLQVTTVLNSGITQPIGIVFLSQNDFFVLEKASGQVKRVVNGVIQATPVLDLAVNSPDVAAARALHEVVRQARHRLRLLSRCGPTQGGQRLSPAVEERRSDAVGADGAG